MGWGGSGGSSTPATYTADRMVVSDATGALTVLPAATTGQMLMGITGNTPALGDVVGTANQITVTPTPSTLTLSLPQNIHTGATPTFAGLTLSGFTAKAFVYSDASKALVSTAAPTNGQLLIGSTGNIPVVAALTGTSNQITVTNGAGSIILSLPQSIHTGATPTFAGGTFTGDVAITGATSDLTIAGGLTVGNGGGSTNSFAAAVYVNDVISAAIEAAKFGVGGLSMFGGVDGAVVNHTVRIVPVAWTNVANSGLKDARPAFAIIAASWSLSGTDLTIKLAEIEALTLNGGSQSAADAYALFLNAPVAGSAAITHPWALGTSGAAKIGGNLTVTTGGITVTAGALTITAGAVTQDGGNVVVNEAGGTYNFRVEGDNNANMIVTDGTTDSLAFGSAVIAGAFMTFDASAVNRAGVTSVGRGMHQPAATFTQTNAGSTTLAVTARNYIGIPTFAGSNASQVHTIGATVYIAGAPVAGTNTTITNPWALYVAGGGVSVTGNSVITGSLTGLTGLQMSADAGTESRQTVAISDATSVGALMFYRARGTVASPSIIVDGDDLGKVGCWVHGGSGGTGGYYEGAYILFEVAGTVTSGQAPPTRTRFFVCPANGTPTEILRFTATGQVQVLGTNGLTVTGNTNVGSGSVYQVNSTQVVSARKTGWTVSTGTALRTGFDTSTATLTQVAQTLKALIDDLHSTAGHGLIGT